MHEFLLGPSLLFCPGDRPERFSKAEQRADSVIIDLEDAVAPVQKAAARAALVASSLDPAQTVVRINPAGSPDFVADCDAVNRTRYRTVMLAKVESPYDVQQVVAQIDGCSVIALCETAAGVVNAVDIARERGVLGLMWGAEDLVASLGGTSSRDEAGGYRAVAMHARSQVLLAAGAAGIGSIDAVYVAIGDLAGLANEADDAAASGFSAKACIHPSQADVVRRAYAPSDVDAEYARELLQEAESQGGVFQFRGRMIDEPILRHARRMVERVEK
ncbi:HpcH/HpaI aldolase/citrate lyase family protein [Arthrobacter sp. H41]|uniref:HpcH/HpaI aldolase/citrate lyase family protein n=1 Tax=Arthrobacter sp. H41 TaxID=1312978 RepID=UPI00047BBFDF|nr:CoA ester lyase [Arthrobacter sp. H41]